MTDEVMAITLETKPTFKLEKSARPFLIKMLVIRISIRMTISS